MGYFPTTHEGREEICQLCEPEKAVSGLFSGSILSGTNDPDNLGWSLIVCDDCFDSIKQWVKGWNWIEIAENDYRSHQDIILEGVQCSSCSSNCDEETVQVEFFSEDKEHDEIGRICSSCRVKMWKKLKSISDSVGITEDNVIQHDQLGGMRSFSSPEYPETRHTEDKGCQFCWGDDEERGFVSFSTYRRGNRDRDRYIVSHGCCRSCFSEIIELVEGSDVIEDYGSRDISDLVWKARSCGLCDADLGVERGIFEVLDYTDKNSDGVPYSRCVPVCGPCTEITETFFTGILEVDL